MNLFILIFLIGAIGFFLVSTVKIVDQTERGVVMTFGKLSGVCEPGLTLLLPFVQTMDKVDVRISVIDVAEQDVITSDNVSVRVSAVAYFQVIDAAKALLDVEDYYAAIAQLAQVTLRSTIGQHPLDELLSKQDKLNETLAESIERRISNWGVRIDHVEIRSVDLDETMIRAMAQEAEAERGRRARVITALGEFEASEKLAQAAENLSKNPAALTLRSLATLKEIGAEQNTTIIFPVALDSLMPPSVLAQSIAAANHRHVAPAPTAEHPTSPPSASE